MEIIYKLRQSGKTTYLIKKCSEIGGYIVCKDQKQADLIKSKSMEMGLAINYPITYTDFIEKRYFANGVKKFHIDNAEELLQYMTQCEIETITINAT